MNAFPWRPERMTEIQFDFILHSEHELLRQQRKAGGQKVYEGDQEALDGGVKAFEKIAAAYLSKQKGE